MQEDTDQNNSTNETGVNSLVTPQSTQPAPQPSSQPLFQTDQPIHTTQPQKEKKEGGIFSFIATLVIAFVLVQLINAFFFQSYKVFGSSMEPTLQNGDRLIISKLGKTTASVRGINYEPNRGDIIVFIDPLNSELQLIKRVIGLPGERVVIKDGKLTVYNAQNPNGFDPDTQGEYSADLPASSGENDVTVPEGHLFVSGDNREGSNSLDSRNELGTVPEELVIGTLQVRIWPLSELSLF